MKDTRDSRTFDLFRHEPITRLGRDARTEYCDMISRMLAKLDRQAVAAQLSDLLGRPVSKHMLDAWASPRREAHNMPGYVGPFLELATGVRPLTDWAVTAHGGQALYGEAAIQAVLDRELVALELSRASVGKRIRDLRRRMGDLG